MSAFEADPQPAHHTQTRVVGDPRGGCSSGCVCIYVCVSLLPLSLTRCLSVSMCGREQQRPNLLLATRRHVSVVNVEYTEACVVAAQCLSKVQGANISKWVGSKELRRKQKKGKNKQIK